jgi:hypothetical protein
MAGNRRGLTGMSPCPRHGSLPGQGRLPGSLIAVRDPSKAASRATQRLAQAGLFVLGGGVLIATGDPVPGGLFLIYALLCVGLAWRAARNEKRSEVDATINRPTSPAN